MKSFLNKHVDFIITDREETVKKSFRDKLKISNEKRSSLMLGIATTKVPAIRGSSSVFKIASIWNIKILKYTDLVSCMEEYQYKPIRLGAQIRINTKGLVHALRNPFVKVEDQTRKYRPDIVEMKSFPYLDFNNEGTSSPFDTWFRQNRL